MTYYRGSKKKIAEDLAEIIHDVSMKISKEDGFKIIGYCEPFCGMLSVYQYIPDIFNKNIKYKAGDRNPYVIKIWKALKRGWKPPISCSEDEYYEYKDTKNTSLKAIFLGFACGFRGIFRTTFAPKQNVQSQANNAVYISNKLKNVSFSSGEYDMYSDLKGYVIYCDPPYKNTVNTYSIKDKYNTMFDYDKFKNWIEMMSKNNIIFISEYTKPTKECQLVYKNSKEKLYVV